MCRLLDEKAPPAVLTSMLLCLSQLARMSPDFYDPIRQADALRHVRVFTGRMTSANCCERSPREAGIEGALLPQHRVDVAFMTNKCLGCASMQSKPSGTPRSHMEWSPL